MSVQSKALREKRATLMPRMEELRELSNKDDHQWSEENETNWRDLNKDYDGLTRKIDVEERADELARQQIDPPGDDPLKRGDATGRGGQGGGEGEVTAEHRNLAMQAWFRVQSDLDIDERQQEACERTGLSPTRRTLRFGLAPTADFRALARELREGRPERRALSTVVGSTGAYLIPEGFVNSLEQNQLWFGGMLQVADVMRTESGAPLPWPTADDTSNEGELLAESATIGSSVDPTLGQIIFGAHKISSKLIKVPSELLEDSTFPIATEVGGWIGGRLGRIQNRLYTLGTGGGNQPRGIAVAASLGVTAASATLIAADELIDLEHSVDPAYRTPEALYMFHDNILLILRKLKDANGQYLFQSNARERAPDTFNGKRFQVNNHMDSTVASGNKSILWGDFRKYKVRQVNEVRVRRLVERYADNDQEGFIAFMRIDGNLLDAGTAPVKYLQH